MRPLHGRDPELETVHERFGKNERFAMLSLSLDAEKETPRKLIAEKGLAWMQGFLGEWGEGEWPTPITSRSSPRCS